MSISCKNGRKDVSIGHTCRGNTVCAQPHLAPSCNATSGHFIDVVCLDLPSDDTENPLNMHCHEKPCMVDGCTPVDSMGSAGMDPSAGTSELITALTLTGSESPCMCNVQLDGNDGTTLWRQVHPSLLTVLRPILHSSRDPRLPEVLSSHGVSRILAVAPNSHCPKHRGQVSASA